MIIPPINFKKWIDENRELLKPPVCNKVVYEDTEYAEEDGFVEIDHYAEEHEASPMKDFKEKVLEGETI